jgi:hypothetical protein
VNVGGSTVSGAWTIAMTPVGVTVKIVAAGSGVAVDSGAPVGCTAGRGVGLGATSVGRVTRSGGGSLYAMPRSRARSAMRSWRRRVFSMAAPRAGSASGLTRALSISVRARATEAS